MRLNVKGIRIRVYRHLKKGVLFLLVHPVLPVFPFQPPTLEQTWLRTDQSYYLSGDDIHYTVYLFNPLNNQDPVPSRILITEFTNDKGELIQQHFHRISETVSQGELSLSDTLSTGFYWLRAFTQYQVGFAEHLIHYFRVFIVNPQDLKEDDILHEKFSFQPVHNRPDPWVMPENVFSSGDISVQIGMAGERYDPGDRIDLKIRFTGEGSGDVGRFNLLIRNAEQFGAALNQPGSTEEYRKMGGTKHDYLKGQDQQGFSEKNQNIFQPDRKPVYPPQQEIKLRGKLIDPETGEGLGFRAVALTQTGQYPGFELVFTGKDGSFEFNDLRFTNRNNQLVLNAGEKQGILVEKQLVRPAFSPPLLAGYITEMESFSRYLEKRRLDLRFRKFYTESSNGRNEIKRSDDFSSLRVYQKADRIYRLADYIQLKDMREVIIELLPNVKIYSEDGRSRIRLYSHQNAGITPDPLFLVNGRIVKNSDYVLNMDNRNVRQIEVLVKNTSLAPFGPLGIGGVVAIYTADPVPVPSGLILDIEGYHEPQQKSIRNVPSDPEAGHIPDFNPLILWDTECRTDENGWFETSVHANDLTGKFVILVEGITKKGIMFSKIKYFTINRPTQP